MYNKDTLKDCEHTHSPFINETAFLSNIFVCKRYSDPTISIEIFVLSQYLPYLWKWDNVIYKSTSVTYLLLPNVNGHPRNLLIICHDGLCKTSQVSGKRVLLTSDNRRHCEDVSYGPNCQWIYVSISLSSSSVKYKLYLGTIVPNLWMNVLQILDRVVNTRIVVKRVSGAGAGTTSIRSGLVMWVGHTTLGIQNMYCDISSQTLYLSVRATSLWYHLNDNSH